MNTDAPKLTNDRFSELVADKKIEMRTSQKYPFTYACDLLRSCGLAESRSDAAELYEGREEAEALAEMYLETASRQLVVDAFEEELKNSALISEIKERISPAPKM